MNKIKVVSKAGRTQLEINSLKGQQLNENEVYVINSDKVVGLLPVDVAVKKSSFKLIYEVTGLITLREYLVTPLNKERFSWILQCILWNLESMEKVYFNQQYLLLDVDKVMVDPRTRQVYFAYVPIRFFESGYSLREFLLEIVRSGSFEIGEDTDYVQEYFTILNTGMNFSVFSLEQFINKLLGQEAGEKQNTESIKQQTVSKREKSYAPVTNDNRDHAKAVYNPLEAGNVEASREENKPRTAYLIRVVTGERILIDKAVFCIGKDATSNDYVVTGNPAVSREHAEIITDRGRYFIFDLKSTNKTYVNGSVIPDAKKVELASETKIRLANEEFLFILK